jgi:uncharacterized membrane protein
MARGTSLKLPKTLTESLPWILIVGGAVGLISSFVLTWDKLQFLKNPNFIPNCDLNPVLSCGSVMVSDQANAFGFPNPWIGLAAFAVLITVGMGILAGAKFKRWFWLGLEIGLALGLVFALWLLFESIYSINALCPYCLAVDVAVITMIWYTTLYLIDNKLITVPKKATKVAAFARRHHLDILVAIFVIIIAIILNHFWYYYGQQL